MASTKACRFLLAPLRQLPEALASPDELALRRRRVLIVLRKLVVNLRWRTSERTDAPPSDGVV